MKLIKQKDYPLLSRKRYTYELEHVDGSTPSKAGVKEKLANLLKVNPELVAIRHIFSKYGVGISKVIAHVYEDANVMKYLEAKKEKKKKDGS